MFSPQEQETNKTYNLIAAGWTKTLRNDFWLEEYKVFTNYLKKGKILDVGCGSGRDSLWFTQEGYDVVGIDFSEAMIKLARAANPQAEFFVRSFYDLGFPEKSFDGWWAACSLMHAPKEKISEVLFGIKKVLKPEAVGFVAVKLGEGEKMVEWQNSGKNRFFVYYGQEEFAKILEVAGFKILQILMHPPKKGQDQDGTFICYYIKN